jgi:cytochrome c-type biogenesis protein CcmH
MFWVAIAALTVVALFLLLRPLLRRGGGPAPDADIAADRAVYRDQLAELERDRARGLLTEEAAASARLEIERRLLATDRAEAPRREQAPAQSRRFALLLAVVAAALAGLLYLELGSPDLPDQPRPPATAGEAPAATGSADPALAAETAALAARLDANPSDAEGWAKLGELYLRQGEFERSRTAFEQAIQQGADDRLTQSSYGEALTQLAGGTVGPEAATAFRRALAAEPGEPRARYYLGLMKAEAGELEQAIADWRALLAETAADAPWRALLERSIAAAEQARGGSAAPPGPDAESLAAAEAMTPEERESFVRGMVEGLAAKLADNPGDLEGWQRLAHAYGVLGEREKARDAWAEAAALAPERIDLLLDYATAILAAAPEGAPLGPAFDAAVATIRERDPGSLAGLYFAGLAAARSGKPDEARAHFETLLRALPADAPQRQQIEREIEALGTN